MDWKQAALELYKNGIPLSDLKKEIAAKFFPDVDIIKACEKVRGYIRGTTEYKAAHGGQPEEVLKPDEPITKESLKQETAIYQEEWKGIQVIRFGLIGDSHIGSKYEQPSLLNRLYDTYARLGIENVYHCGDITEGEEMRVGHKYECYLQGADDILSHVANRYPKRNGVKTKFIIGNHDESLIKRAGYDIGKAIANRRDDMVYLGASSAVVYLTPNCTLELSHPGGGSAYAISYKTQKAIDAMSGGEKPNILAVGHYHKAEYLFYRNVHAFQVGTTQAQTPFMKGKQLSAHMGGWVIEIGVDTNGYIQYIKPEFIPCYYAVKDDYLRG